MKSRTIIGDHAIREFFQRRPEDVIELWVQGDWRQDELCKGLLKRHPALERKIVKKPLGEMQKVGPHQGLVVLAKPLLDLSPEQLMNRLGPREVLVYLDGIVDPHNFGAIVRTCWLMGVRALLHSADRSVGLSPTVHKVACGGVEWVPFISINQLSAVKDLLQEHGFWVFGLDHEARESLHSKSVPERICWVIGSEEKGMRSTIRSQCDELISIPQKVAAASYNASVAAALALGETVRQHSSSGKSNL